METETGKVRLTHSLGAIGMPGTDEAIEAVAHGADAEEVGVVLEDHGWRCLNLGADGSGWWIRRSGKHAAQIRVIPPACI